MQFIWQLATDLPLGDLGQGATGYAGTLRGPKKAAAVRSGSECERLRSSKCFPVLLQHRISSDAVSMSVRGHNLA
jgi:hypothetical protein